MLRAAVWTRAQELYLGDGSGVCRGGLSGVWGPSVGVREWPSLETQLNKLMIRALYRILED